MIQLCAPIKYIYNIPCVVNDVLVGWVEVHATSEEHAKEILQMAFQSELKRIQESANKEAP